MAPMSDALRYVYRVEQVEPAVLFHRGFRASRSECVADPDILATHARPD
jgi:hypothetical protein